MQPKVAEFIIFHKLLTDMSRIFFRKWAVRQLEGVFKYGKTFSNMKTCQVSQEEAPPAEKAGAGQGQ
jgi:hypothetical protein